jgi:transposase
MPHGKAISEDLRWVIIHMSTKLSLQIDTISNLTTVSRRTIEGVLSRHRQTGLVVRQDLTDSRGRKRALDYDDLAVS